MEKPPPKRFYPPCEPRRRARARVIDIAFASGVWWALRGNAGPIAAATYLALADGAGGQSPGKRLCGIRVVEPETGTPCGFKRSILRNAAYIVTSVAGRWGGFPAGVLGWMLVSAIEWIAVRRDPDGRRFGDHAAGTQVIDASIPLGEVQRPRMVIRAPAVPAPPARRIANVISGNPRGPCASL